MNKARDSRKDVKKAPTKTMKEKRSDKHFKKEMQQLEFHTKPHHGLPH